VIFRNESERQKNDLQMTSMIDVVFLLLIFFMLNFKVVEQEGDFSVRMPLAAAAAGQPEDDIQLPLNLRLRADANGRLAKLQLNDIDLGTDFDKLRATVLSLVGDQRGGSARDSGPELEIDTDYDLRYEHVIQAITAVSGERIGDQVIPIIERIKFAPPRKES
jgi:biopolymer transport protein ExbD